MNYLTLMMMIFIVVMKIEYRDTETMVEIKETPTVVEKKVMTYSLDSILSAITTVEGGEFGKDNDVTGDSGAALGPLQIHKAYHSDAADIHPALTDYSRCNEWQYSYTTFITWMSRYIPFQSWSRMMSDKATIEDVERIARCHNGGPTGHMKEATIPYWNKVKELL